ncbi:hypothetical protein ACJJTC_001997, partial [Scirpophaga incertulas]
CYACGKGKETRKKRDKSEPRTLDAQPNQPSGATKAPHPHGVERPAATSKSLNHYSLCWRDSTSCSRVRLRAHDRRGSFPHIFFGAETREQVLYDSIKRTMALNHITKALEIGTLAHTDASQHDLFFSYCDQAEKIKDEFELAHMSILELLASSEEDDNESLTDDDLRIRFDDMYFKEFRLNTVTYGVSSAPFLACKTIKQLAADEGSRFPLAKQLLASDIYIDDVITGCDTLSDALESKSQITKLFESGHFQLRKWASNSPKLLSDLSPEECLFDCKAFTDGQQLATLKLWILGVSWDEEPPESISGIWKTFCSQLSKLTELRIPRRLTNDNRQSYELHGFCDSSELAYGAVIYQRVVCADGSFQTRLLCAKARVAPLKKLSLPRLELCGAVMLADLTKFVLDTYQIKIPTYKIFLWTDSTVVLSWLRSHSSRWSTFVANRVSHIQGIVPAESWNHVASRDNPADVCSRGQLPQELLSNNTLWWAGPVWLSQRNDCWPNTVKFPSLIDVEEEAVRTEERNSVALIAPSNDTENIFDLLLKRFSSLAKIIRIVSYVRRFVHNIRKRNRLERHTESILTTYENHQSVMLLVKTVQASVFNNEIQRLNLNQPLSKPFRKLNPFIDKRAKWTKVSKPLSLNSIVMIKDDNRNPLQWSLGRVIDLHPGLDGVVRVATVKTKDSCVKRPLVKLCPLPSESDS